MQLEADLDGETGEELRTRPLSWKVVLKEEMLGWLTGILDEDMEIDLGTEL